jgi:hypothetical protein
MEGIYTVKRVKNGLDGVFNYLRLQINTFPVVGESGVNAGPRQCSLKMNYTTVDDQNLVTSTKLITLSWLFQLQRISVSLGPSLLRGE